MHRTPSQPPPFQRAELGEGQDKVGYEIRYSYKILIPLPPNPFADLGEGREGGHFSLVSIANSLYLQFDIFENAMELVGFRYIDLIEHFEK
jgi:hypothetical protein